MLSMSRFVFVHCEKSLSKHPVRGTNTAARVQEWFLMIEWQQVSYDAPLQSSDIFPRGQVQEEMMGHRYGFWESSCLLQQFVWVSRKIKSVASNTNWTRWSWQISSSETKSGHFTVKSNSTRRTTPEFLTWDTIRLRKGFYFENWEIVVALSLTSCRQIDSETRPKPPSMHCSNMKWK